MIRQATHDDWEYISDISARSGYDDYINTQYGPSYLNSCNVYVIIDKTIQGFIKLEKLTDRALWFSGLRVNPESRRKRLGTQLLDFAYGFAYRNGLNTLRCMVETGNWPSIKLMESYGMGVVSKFFFFIGGIDTSNYLYKETKLNNFINKEWKFEHNSGKVYRKGNAQVAIYRERREYYTVLSGTSFEYNDTGTTCAPEGIARYIKLPTDGEFPSGYIFEKQVTSSPI